MESFTQQSCHFKRQEALGLISLNVKANASHNIVFISGTWSLDQPGYVLCLILGLLQGVPHLLITFTVFKQGELGNLIFRFMVMEQTGPLLMP